MYIQVLRILVIKHFEKHSFIFFFFTFMITHYFKLVYFYEILKTTNVRVKEVAIFCQNIKLFYTTLNLNCNSSEW